MYNPRDSRYGEAIVSRSGFPPYYAPLKFGFRRSFGRCGIAFARCIPLISSAMIKKQHGKISLRVWVGVVMRQALRIYLRFTQLIYHPRRHGIDTDVVISQQISVWDLPAEIKL